MKKAKIISCGGYLPEQRITNEDLSKLVDTSDEWIRERTGITQRFVVKNGQTTSDIASQAALTALNKISCNHIDCIIVATTTPDYTFPSTACVVQQKLSEYNITSNFAFDIQAVCAGFVYAMSLANSMIASNMAQKILVIGADSLSNILDWTDRETCVLFGDGAGAVVLESTSYNDTHGIIYSELHSDGKLFDILKTTGGTSTTKQSGFIKMNGKEVFRHAVSKMTSSIENILLKSNFTKDDISYIIAHQANERILNAVAQKLQIPDKKFIKTIQIHANTSSASIPLAMWHSIEANTMQSGDLIVLEALGAGLTWGGMILRF